MRAALAAALTFTSAAPLAAEVAFLDLPIDCNIGRDCFVEDYVDAIPGPGVADYACGLKARQDHSGTDFALLSYAAMDDGVNVLAAAPGIVEAVREGEQDIAFTPQRRDAIRGRECGNAVRIGHANGLTTLYCHMKQGSVAVRPGETVRGGAILGEVGLSGETNYPHLHLTVLRGKTSIDPFAPIPGIACGGTTDTLWINPPAYTRAGLFTAGFATEVPSLEAVQSGAARVRETGPDAALVLYGHAFHAEAGDVLHLSAVGPAGEIFAAAERIGRDRAQLFRAFGRRAPDGGWPHGAYRGTVRHMRGDTVLAVRHADIEVH